MARKVDKEGTRKRREQIVQAALDCFNKNGIHKSGMQEICATASLSPGTVYHYFKSKDAIVEYIAELEVEKARELTDQLLEEQSLQQGLHKLVDGILDSDEYDDFQIFMEIVCEAGRNRKVEKLLLKSELIWLETIKSRLKKEGINMPGASAMTLPANECGQGHGGSSRHVDPFLLEP